MAVIKQGLLGQFSGAIGSVQGARWKNISYMQGRITSNGHSTTNSAIESRTRFGSLRSLLSLIKNDFMAFSCPVFNKKIGQWASWVKSVFPSFPDTYEWYGANILFAKGSISLTPDVSFVTSVGVGFDTYFVFNHVIPSDMRLNNIRTRIYCVSSKKLIGTVDMNPVDFSNFIVLVPNSELEGHEYILFMIYTEDNPSNVFSNGIGYSFSDM